MGRNVHQIRRSQFVLTYGPGAIIESQNGPRLIPRPDRGLGNLFRSDRLKHFEITDSRLRAILSNMRNRDAKIFALPSNASLGKSESQGIYGTYIFPVWKVCYGRKENHRPVLHRNETCPVCSRADDSSPIRFVVACVEGHLDEVDWKYAVHSSKNCNRRCSPDYFYWKAGSSSLSGIVVKCPDCGCSTTMQDVYRMDFYCTGRFPEREYPKFQGRGSPFYTRIRRPRACSEKMKVIQRQSSSLRLPETITLLTIPEYDNSISRILQRSDVAAALGMAFSFLSSSDEDMDVNSFLKNIRGGLSSENLQVIEDFVKENGIEGLRNLYNALHTREKTFVDYVYEEFESLLQGNRSTENFSMSPATKVPSIGPAVPDLYVYPVEKLRTVTAQMGYRRVPYMVSDLQIISSGVYLDDSLWYPGFEGIGEGLFITFSGEGPDISEVEKWGQQNQFNFDTLWGEMVQEPLFVWLHTLSHSIIKALSLKSGYSPASLRERVYIDRNARRGGILIYTTSPGEDGSMGGLVGAVRDFEQILRRALRNIKYCSNDPLCREVEKSPEKVTGAACYSCLLVSETSCEHRNMWLDRHAVGD